MDIYDKRIFDDIEAVQEGCYSDIVNLHNYSEELGRQILYKLIEWACKPQNDTPIKIARERIAQINKEWLKVHFLDVAKACIDFSDYWEYRRLLELIVLVLHEAKMSVLKICEDSEDEDIREVIEDYKEDV